MIRPSNIDKQGKKADFRCDLHGGVVEKLNLRTKAKRVKNHDGGPPDGNSQDLIIVQGNELTPSCFCSSAFPTWSDGNKLGKALGEAKTKDD